MVGPPGSVPICSLPWHRRPSCWSRPSLCKLRFNLKPGQYSRLAPGRVIRPGIVRCSTRHAEGGEPMAEFDTVIGNAVVATAADVFSSDIGIAGGVITALGRN